MPRGRPKGSKNKTKETKRLVPATPEPLPNGLVLGALVSYYRDGFYTGWLEAIKGTTATIKPITAMEHKKVKRFKVPVLDVICLLPRIVP